jgi:hypothetical protein
MSAAVVLPLSMYPRLRRAQGVLDRASVDLGAFPLSFDDALPACGPRGGASGVQITWNKKWSIKYTTISRTTIPPMFLAFKISTPE